MGTSVVNDYHEPPQIFISITVLFAKATPVSRPGPDPYFSSLQEGGADHA
jgi:hypothetical protein